MREGWRAPIPTPRSNVQLCKPETAVSTSPKDKNYGNKENSSRLYQISRNWIEAYCRSFGPVTKYKLAISRLLDTKLHEMWGYKITEVIKVTFKRRKDGKMRHEEQYFNNRPQIVIYAIDISESLNLSQQKLLTGIAVWLREGSGWLVENINGHCINIVKYNPLRGNSYIPLPEELRHGRKVLVNIKNKDNECFRWCHVRQLSRNC